MMKTRQDNDAIGRIGAVYVKSEIVLSWSTKLSVVYDKNKKEQTRD